MINNVNNLFLRRLTQDDVNSVVDIVCRAFDSERIAQSVSGTLVYYCDSGCQLLSINEQKNYPVPVEYWVVSSHDSVYGMCGIYRLNWAWEKSFWIGWFAIDPAYQKSGIGTATVKRLMDISILRGANVLKVETLDGGPAENFYKKIGFEKEAILSKHYGENSDAAVLSINLDSPDKAIENGPIPLFEGEK